MSTNIKKNSEIKVDLLKIRNDKHHVNSALECVDFIDKFDGADTIENQIDVVRKVQYYSIYLYLCELNLIKVKFEQFSVTLKEPEKDLNINEIIQILCDVYFEAPHKHPVKNIISK